jgi:predicted HAD superfamily Cof-like phosphohydrolase
MRSVSNMLNRPPTMLGSCLTKGSVSMVRSFMGKKGDNMTNMEMVEEFRTTMDQEKNIETSVRLISEEYAEWANEFHKYTLSLHSTKPVEYVPEGELKELADLIYVIYGYANARGWDLDKAIKRVHLNNLGRCIQPDGTIKRREDGKVLKNPDYPKIDLGDLV